MQFVLCSGLASCFLLLGVVSPPQRASGYFGSGLAGLCLWLCQPFSNGSMHGFFGFDLTGMCVDVGESASQYLKVDTEACAM